MTPAWVLVLLAVVAELCLASEDASGGETRDKVADDLVLLQASAFKVHSARRRAAAAVLVPPPRGPAHVAEHGGLQPLAPRPESLVALRAWPKGRPLPRWLGALSKVLTVGGMLLLLAAGTFYLFAGPIPPMPKEVVDREARMSIVLLCFLYNIWENVCTSQNIPNMPEMQDDLGTTTSLTSFSVQQLHITKGVVGLVIGVVCDHIGRRRTILFFFALLPFSMVACGLAPDIWWLLAARLVQGVSEGAIVATAGVIRDLYPQAEERAGALAAFAAVQAVVPSVSPALGGMLGNWLGWRATFILLAPGMVVCWLHLYYRLPETLAVSPDIGQTFWAEVWQVLSSFHSMSLAGTLGLIFGILVFFSSDVSIILERDLGLTVLQTCLFLGLTQVFGILGAVATQVFSHRHGVLKMFYISLMLLIVTIALLVLAGAVLSPYWWAFMGVWGAACGFVTPLMITAEVLYMQPFEHVFATAQAVVQFLQHAVGPLVIAVPGTALLKGGDAARRCNYWAAACIAAFVAVVWLGFGRNPPEWALEMQKAVEDERLAEAKEESAVGGAAGSGGEGVAGANLLLSGK